MRGVLLLTDPQAKPGRHQIAGMKGLDITATVCELAGVRPGMGIDGTSRVRDRLTILPGSRQ
jgi:hypothetical protein